MAERELPKLNTRVRFPSPAFARSFLAGYSAAGPALGYPVKHDPPKGRKRRAEVPPQRPEGGPTAFGYPDKCDPPKGESVAEVPPQRLEGDQPLSATPLNMTYPKRRKRRAEVPPQRLEGGPTQRCTTFTFSNPLLCPVTSTLDPPIICGSACGSIRPTSMLIRPSTVLGSSKPTWHSRRKRLRFVSRVTSNPAQVGHFVSATSTSGSSPFFKGLHYQPLSATPIKREQRKGRNGWPRGHVSGRVMTIHLASFFDCVGAKSVLLY
jgi:hypothetical protein